MAGVPRYYFRNWDSNDNTYVMNGSAGSIVLSPSEVGFEAPSGKDFVTWNTARDGSGESAPVGAISWIESNLYAIWSENTHEVSITYGEDVIASLDGSGTKTLQTDGKYCSDDITIEYTRPSPMLQSKTIVPTTQSQLITADNLYDGLSSVNVGGIYPVKSAQTYTPTTTNQVIASGRWLTGDQTILGDANLVSGNIKKDVSIFGVTGTHEGSSGAQNVVITVLDSMSAFAFIYVPRNTTIEDYIDYNVGLVYKYITIPANSLIVCISLTNIRTLGVNGLIYEKRDLSTGSSGLYLYAFYVEETDGSITT